MVRPIGYVHHVVSFRTKTLPKPVMKLFPLFPGYEKGSIYFFLLFTFLSTAKSLFYQHLWITQGSGLVMRRRTEQMPFHLRISGLAHPQQLGLKSCVGFLQKLNCFTEGQEGRRRKQICWCLDKIPTFLINPSSSKSYRWSFVLHNNLCCKIDGWFYL